MPQTINTNLPSLFTQRQLNKTGSLLETSMQRLSSGLRINSAKDDAAGLAIGTRFSAQIGGLNMAARNANDGVSISQTAEAGLDQITSSLQRLRELSVQASNGTLSNADRGSLNLEAKQIVDEIGRVSETTEFNGKKLLDGSAKNMTLQVGSNAHQSFKFDIDGARTDQLGVMQTTSASSMVRQYSALEVGNNQNYTQQALQQGDLILNGTAIGASLSTDDQASVSSTIVAPATVIAQKAASAIAKSAAINRESAKTGVSAKTNATQAEGVTMAGAAAATAESLTINGVTISATVAQLDTASTRLSVVNAINQKSGQTGVIAVNTHDDNQGIELAATDGRNIDVSMVGAALSADLGIKSGVTYGSYTLSSDKAITIGQSLNGRIERSGLQLGSYDKGEATISAAGNNGNAIIASDFKINGVLIGASLATDDSRSTAVSASAAALAAVDASSIAKVAAVNRISGQTGVTATADVNMGRGVTMTATAVNGTIMINGITTAAIQTSATDNAHNRLVTLSAINEISARTGVYAQDTGNDTSGVELVANDGRNISVTFTGAALTSASTGVRSGWIYGGYTLHSSKAITVSAGNGSTTGSGEENGGFALGTFGVGSDGTALKDINLSTEEGAQKAITAVDYAMDSINNNRSNLGAVQNRLTSNISQLQAASESFSASRSRIMDTDFAVETAALTKAQVMNQAGVAMLAQAKALPQQVMSLLQG